MVTELARHIADLLPRGCSDVLGKGSFAEHDGNSGDGVSAGTGNIEEGDVAGLALHDIPPFAQFEAERSPIPRTRSAKQFLLDTQEKRFYILLSRDFKRLNRAFDPGG